mmetsp:Transcript_38867/g.61422  ORF Transcript_38867/g.61422 Transcript_38867/m.61422 type:complete len:226 (-) Transcript_38867:63-740(-)|eukprot:CAMPEP_0169146474 /NCGR_PEP_ID=MMETSP1015-20121227/47603_1 /TAXON_ID=342587 /ORGANISM="Karlodinium micrum, Strain CCMP2283" /LENGTH=225 /DNA_ID=CAMNT_0009214411 /DNA_START=57 /DNA_END=734 /DNA_ORIENTATION=+
MGKSVGIRRIGRQQLVKEAKKKKKKTLTRVVKGAGLGDVEVRASSLPCAGRGLFAATDFAQGALLPGPYQGRRLSRTQLQRLRDFSYCMMIPGKSSACAAIDAKTCLRKTNPLAFVNGAKTRDQSKLINVKMLHRGGEVYFKTTRCVRSGSEFIVDYGKSYWEGLEHNCRLDTLRKNLRVARKEMASASNGPLALQRKRKQALQQACDDWYDYINDVDTDSEEDK